MKLNAKQIAAIRDPGRYADGAGLYLQVTSTGVRSWVLRYERGGRERMLGLGTLRDVGLAQARERASRARIQLLDGIDPIQAKRATKVAKAVPIMTFKQAVMAYYKQHQAKWKGRHSFLPTMETYAFPVIGKMDVRTITTDDVLRVISDQWDSKTETMNRVRRRIETLISWAIVSGYRTADNPAVWKGRLAVILPPPGKVAKVQHHPALPFAETAAFMAELRKREGTAARALEITILTAVRTNECLGARWSEIDLDNATWTIPANRTKTGEELRVPLSAPVLALLRALPTEEGNEFVFMGRFAGSRLADTAMADVVRALRPGITVHGFRSTFRDWSAETTGHDNHVVEMALGHAISNAVERAYRRGDLFTKRRVLMEEWAAFCDGKAAVDNVVPFAQAAQ